MAAGVDISAHYSRGTLLQRLQAALAADGVDSPTIETLAPYDHFHGRGFAATQELAERLAPRESDHILDIGSGIGGPARYVAARYGCRVSGIDLTPEFCEVARILTRALALAARVDFHEGDALSMPFSDASFDRAYSMNVAMNIADKARFYREIRRVLKPGALLALSEIAQGAGGAPDFPTPWAKTAATSFLATPEETRRHLEAAGFVVLSVRDTAQEALDFAKMSRAMVDRGEQPPHRAVRLIHGDAAAEMAANTGRGLAEGRLVPVEFLCRTPE